MGFKKHHDVKIFTVPNNKLCELAREYFRDRAIDYLEFNIAKDNNAVIKMVEISGQDQAPVVELDGRVIVGYRPDMYEPLITDRSKKDEEKGE